MATIRVNFTGPAGGVPSRDGNRKGVRLAATAALLTGLCSIFAASAQTRTPPPPSSAASTASRPGSPEEIKRWRDWSISIMRKPAPRKGCFAAAFPATEWREVACGPARNIPMIPKNGPRPQVVGNSNDISALAPSGHISQAIGHFENVTNVTSESGPIGNSGPSIANAYTLQINTNFFGGTAVCTASPNPGCQGWEQFVYENDGSNGYAYIQYWIIAYNATCPAGQSWNQIALYGGTYCWKNNSGGSVSVPNQPITNMANWTFSGQVSATGDSVTMSTGTMAYTRNGDNAVDAANGWTTAEFNIFGDGGNSSGGGTATFNAGASADARTQIFYGDRNAPTCVAQGFTAEMNNLSFGPTAPAATAPGPAVIFTESIAGGAMSNCAAAVTIGDTHLRTFNGLFYDFQASGDFTLAEVAPNFEVQTRQASGAPTWPDASVNKAVAARFGKTRVALCAAPAGESPAAQVFVDGTSTPVDDGKMLELPEGAVLYRRGNTYLMAGAEGDSLRATVNAYGTNTWIDVDVGLGRWPSAVKGLLANVNGNVNQIAARDNVVLQSPFKFDAFYHHFTDSWRVDAAQSLLSVCDGGKPVERGIPKRPFYARDLDRTVRAKAAAVCAAAGVKDERLLEACTLDVAVIGRDEAARVYVGAILPVAIGTIVAEEPGGFHKPWLWLLALVAIAVIVWLLMRRR